MCINQCFFPPLQSRVEAASVMFAEAVLLGTLYGYSLWYVGELTPNVNIVLVSGLTTTLHH
jgi:hypothetical protein